MGCAMYRTRIRQVLNAYLRNTKCDSVIITDWIFIKPIYNVGNIIICNLIYLGENTNVTRADKNLRTKLI